MQVLHAAPYRLNPSRFSSHSLLLDSLPRQGAGRRVLDLGCADGYLAEILAARGYSVVGIDTAQRAREGFPDAVQFVAADLDGGLPPLSGRFDFILCADVLEHLRDPLKLLLEIPRLLGGGGQLLASLPNSGNAYFRWNVLLGRFPQHDRGLFDCTHLHFYPWDGWVQLFSAAGFRIENVRCSGVPVSLALPRWRDTLPVRILERLSFEAARLWKTLFAYQFIVAACPEPRL